jgi:hypothetical protein
MASDLLEQLAQSDVPPMPGEFDRQLNDRLNGALVAVQVADFLLRALPWAMMHFGQALWGLMSLTFLGRFEADRGGRPPQAP